MTKWQHIAPLENIGSRGFTTVHPCEKKIDLKAEYVGKNKLKIRWQEKDFPDGAVNNLMAHSPIKEWAACCLYREIQVEQDCEVPASFGSDDTLTVWLNGKKIIADPTQRACEPDQNKATLKLKAGKNQLLIKICQGDGDWAFYFSMAQPACPGPDRARLSRMSPRRSAWVPMASAPISRAIRSPSAMSTATAGPISSMGPARAFSYWPPRTRKASRSSSKRRTAGISFTPGKINPIFADFDNDGHPDLLVPQKGSVKLFKNDGKGRFTDVTAKSGALAKFTGWATSAAVGDVDNDGHLDLVVGCLKGPNRYFRNKGDGTFEDATEAIGLHQKIFNTQAVSLVDLQNRGVLDFIFNNEGQDSVVLLANPTQAGKRVPLTLTIAAKDGLTGSTVELLDKAGKRVGTRQLSGGDGRGGQQSPIARFTLEPGQYRANVRLSDGQVLTKNITLGADALRMRIDETAKMAARAE